MRGDATYIDSEKSSLVSVVNSLGDLAASRQVHSTARQLICNIRQKKRLNVEAKEGTLLYYAGGNITLLASFPYWFGLGFF